MAHQLNFEHKYKFDSLRQGITLEVSLLTGAFTAYGHELTLETLETIFFTTVYFAEDDTLKRNLLGRLGWLQLVRLAIIDYDSEVYLSPYDQV